MDGIKALFEKFCPLNFWDTNNNKEMVQPWDGSRYREEDWNFYKHLRDTSPTTDPKRLTLLCRVRPDSSTTRTKMATAGATGSTSLPQRRTSSTRPMMAQATTMMHPMSCSIRQEKSVVAREIYRLPANTPANAPTAADPIARRASFFSPQSANPTDPSTDKRTAAPNDIATTR